MQDQRSKAPPRRRSQKLEFGDVSRIGAALLLLLLALALLLLRLLPVWVLAAYGLLGGLSAALYTVDKRAAELNRWRISEATLHLVDLIGGIAGGLLAQFALRHKTRKSGFIAITALLVLLHLGALLTLAFGLWQFPALLFF